MQVKQPTTVALPFVVERGDGRAGMRSLKPNLMFLPKLMRTNVTRRATVRSGSRTIVLMLKILKIAEAGGPLFSDDALTHFGNRGLSRHCCTFASCDNVGDLCAWFESSTRQAQLVNV